MNHRKPKILIIEDNHFLLVTYSRKFLAEGFIVHGAQTAQIGLAEAKSIQPDIIMLDIILPDEDGLSVLKKLKRSKETAGTPVVMLSNISEGLYREQAKIFGAIAYVIKAYTDPNELVAIIKSYLQ